MKKLNLKIFPQIPKLDGLKIAYGCAGIKSKTKLDISIIVFEDFANVASAGGGGRKGKEGVWAGGKALRLGRKRGGKGRLALRAEKKACAAGGKKRLALRVGKKGLRCGWKKKGLRCGWNKKACAAVGKKACAAGVHLVGPSTATAKRMPRWMTQISLGCTFILPCSVVISSVPCCGTAQKGQRRAAMWERVARKGKGATTRPLHAPNSISPSAL